MKSSTAFLFLACIAFQPVMAQYQPLYERIPNYIDAPNEESEQVQGILRISKVSIPGYAFFSAGNEGIKKPCVVICPGGGYGILAAQHEGTDVAKYFNSIGVHAIVLKYRLPSPGHQPDPKIAPLQDAQQAIALVRQHAKEWNVDPKKVGIMGFSAGGHLASTAATHFNDKQIAGTRSVRPDFQILVYPVITFGEKTHKGSRNNLLRADTSERWIEYFSNELQVKASTPKAFVVHAADDKVVPVENARAYVTALKFYNVDVDYFEFEKGGHGFGMVNKMSAVDWTALMKSWMVKEGIL